MLTASFAASRYDLVVPCLLFNIVEPSAEPFQKLNRSLVGPNLGRTSEHLGTKKKKVLKETTDDDCYCNYRLFPGNGLLMGAAWAHMIYT